MKRRVPQSKVPGEQSAPTQPIPVKPPPFGRMSFRPEDLVTAADTNEEHAQACRDLVEKSGGVINQGPFQPLGLSRARSAADVSRDVSRRDWRHQLGRHGVRPEARDTFSPSPTNTEASDGLRSSRTARRFPTSRPASWAIRLIRSSGRGKSTRTAA